MASDLVGEPRAHFEIERVARLRPIEAEHDNVVRRAFDEQGVRRGHSGSPIGRQCCANHKGPSKGPPTRFKVNVYGWPGAVCNRWPVPIRTASLFGDDIT